MSHEDLLGQASQHAAAGLEMINQLRAVHNFAEQKIIDQTVATHEVTNLAKKYEEACNQATDLVRKFVSERFP